MKLYKVQRVSDGLFSTGGTNPKFNNRGKDWKRIGDLKNHLNLLQETEEHKPFYEWVHPYKKDKVCIVEYDFGISIHSADDITNKLKDYL